jgi:hypothetical protein
MKIHIGEFLNLINNSPVFAGDTISHQTMQDLIDVGFATRNEHGEHIPTKRGKWVYNQLTCKTIEVKEKHEFSF